MHHGQRACRRVVGATAGQVLVQNFRHIASWQQCGMLQAAEETLHTGETRQGEFHITTSFGKEIWLDCAFTTFESNGRRHLLLVADDVTERKHDEMALAQARNELERRVEERTAQLLAANREMESFSYSVAHDLRAPLRSIDGFSHLLAESCNQCANKKPYEHIGRIRSAAGGMGQLIDDMLELARLSRIKLAKGAATCRRPPGR